MIENVLYQLSELFYLIGVEILVIVIALFCVIQLKRSHQNKFAKLIQDSPSAMLVFEEKTGEILLANKPAMQVLAIRQVGRRYLFPLSVYSKKLITLLSKVKGRSLEKQLLSWSFSDFQSIQVELTCRKIRYKGKKVWLLYFIKHQEAVMENEEVRTSLKIARSALDSLTELIHIKDNDGNLLDTNKAFDTFWKNREEESDVIIRGGMRGRKSQRRWTTDLQGRSCLLETSQTSLLSVDGDILGTLAISHNVTDWFKMQQDLRDEMARRKGTEVALAQRDIILESILASSPDVIALFNESRVYEACNQAYIDSLDLDLTPEQLVGQQVEDILPEHLKQRFVDTDNRVLVDGETLRYVDEIIDKNGKAKWYDVVKSPYIDPSSGVKGILLLARDVSARFLAEQKLEEMNQELARLSFLDSLTKVANRRRFDEQLETVWNLHRRQRSTLTVILCDLDFFKDYNDNYGHLKGDQALVDVASAFKQTLTRSSDCVARYGGEEFAFILPNTDHNSAQIITNKIHLAVKSLKIEHLRSQVSDQMTVSIGVVSLIPEFGDTPELAISHADEALYLAKKEGRNQTQYYYP